MDLKSYKSKALRELLRYEPKNETEREYLRKLSKKISRLRRNAIPSLLSLLSHIMYEEDNVTNDFKELVRRIIPNGDQM